MILSHSQGFLFVKSRKVAGTSIEIILSLQCSKGDVITPISPEDELTRKTLGGRLPGNFSTSDECEAAYCQAIEAGKPAEIATARKRAEASQVFWNHMPAQAIKAILSDETWRELFKFTIDRHPYEKAVSQAYFQYARKSDPKPDFADFLDLVVRRGTYRNFDLYAADGTILLDRVLKYEDLPDCLSAVNLHKGSLEIDRLPLTKNRFRKDTRPAADILSRRQKEFIAHHCEAEFDLLGYDR